MGAQAGPLQHTRHGDAHAAERGRLRLAQQPVAVARREHPRRAPGAAEKGTQLLEN